MVAVATIAILFARRQNRNPKLGGAISKAKQLWLAYAIYVWFCLSPILAFEPAIDPSLRRILATFAAWMWIRGIAEMVMMYWTKTWRPPYGIAHDLSSIALIAGLMTADLSAIAALPSQLDRWTIAFLLALIASLSFETYYAYAFFAAVEGKTTGEEGVWFASEDDPRFVRINRVTRVGNTILCAFLAAYLVAAFAQ